MTHPEGWFKGDIASIGSVDIEGPLPSAQAPCCQYYTSAYGNAARAAKEKGDDTAAEFYTLLSTVTSFLPCFDTPGQPYGPLFQMQDRRGLTPADLTPSDIGAIRKLANHVADPALKARLLDVIWVCAKDHVACGEAADEYLLAAQRLDNDENWVHAVENYQRSLYLAGVLGKSKERFDRVTEAIVESARRAGTEPRGFFCCKMLELLLRFKIGDPKEFGPIAETVARQAHSDGEWRRARHYWLVAADWRKREKDIDRERAARTSAAETHVSEARSKIGAADASGMAASHHLSRGIEALRRVGTSPERIEELKQLLAGFQKAALGEMKQFSHEVDLSEAVEFARKLVTQSTIREALVNLVFGHALVKPDKIRAEVLELAGKYPFQHLVNTTILDERGRPVAQTAGLLGLQGEAYEVAVEAKMFQHAASFNWFFGATAFIEPARLQIFNDHHPSLDELEFLVINNPFVPAGHEAFYLRGLHAGFHGDFIVATHLLVPQIENSVRYVLESHGVDVSTLKPDGTQPVKVLGALLEKEETLQVFGKELCFALRGCLNEKTGFDLRNKLAHGFLRMEECYSVAPVYVWWLILRILLTPTMAASSRSGNLDPDESMKQPMAATQSDRCG